MSKKSKCVVQDRDHTWIAQNNNVFLENGGHCHVGLRDNFPTWVSCYLGQLLSDTIWCACNAIHVWLVAVLLRTNFYDVVLRRETHIRSPTPSACLICNTHNPVGKRTRTPCHHTHDALPRT